MRRIQILALCALLLFSACSQMSALGTETQMETAQTAGTELPTATPSQTPKKIEITETPAPTATPAPTEEPTPEPTAEPTPSPTPVPEPFKMVWASDTQIMVAYYQEMLDGYTAMCDWVSEHAEQDRMKLFLHTGDMVDGCDNLHQWKYFSEGVAKINEHMPLFMTAGNHDFLSYDKKSYWKQQFFVKDLPREQSYHDGEAAYMEMEVDGFRFLLISLCYREQRNQGHLHWLNWVCHEHKDLPVILIVHTYISKEGKLMDRARNMEEQLVSQCPNIKLILCGHSRGVARTAFEYDDTGDGKMDRTVNVLMYDVQEDREKYGYLCLLTYDPVENSLSMESYSPLLDDYIYDDENPDKERFTIQNVF